MPRNFGLGDHDAAAPRRQEPGESGSGPGPAVLAALRALPRRQREVIALRVFLELGPRLAVIPQGHYQGCA
jgi:DNA-directed RNA polymerase specialized sigma24 family protein